MTEMDSGVIFTGVDDAHDQARIDAGLAALGIDLAPLSAPDGPVQALRNLDAEGFGPRDTLWGMSVEELFGLIKEIKTGVGQRDLGRGSKLRDIAPSVLNPFFGAPGENTDGRGKSFTGKSRRLKLSQEQLRHWNGKVTESSAWSQRIDEESVTLESLAVLIQIRPAPLRSEDARPAW